MKILYLANFKPPDNLKNDIRLALENLGHEVVSLQDDETHGTEILNRSRDCDLVLYVRSYGRNIHGNLASIFAWLKGRGTPTVSIDFDLYFGVLKRHAEIGQHGFWKADHVFTSDFAHQAQFAELGVNHHWLPPAMGDRFLGRGEPKPEYLCDVAFVGVRKHHPEWPQRAELVDWLETTYGSRFKWFGGGSKLGKVWGNDLRDLYASAKVVVGDCFDGGERYWSDRIPNTLGRGGLLIHPLVEGMHAHDFIDGHTLLTYRRGDYKQLKMLIDEWVERQNEAREITGRAIVAVGQNHTQTKRMAEVLRVVTGEKQ